MKLYTYGGETAAQALKIAQKNHGQDALVVKTREVKKKTFNQPGLYEIIVADDDNQSLLDSKTTKKDSIKESHYVSEESWPKRNEPSIYEAQDVYEPSAFARNFNTQERELDARFEQRLSGIKDEQSLRLIKDEIEKLADKINLIQNMFWQEKAPQDIQIPQEFAQIYKIINDAGMYSVHINEIMKLSLELMPLSMRTNSVAIKRYFRELLRKMIYCRDEALDLKHKRIIMLIGPTGVGKTTTLAKLAARFSRLLDKRYKVGIITLDTYRIGAMEQLSWYAQKMKISLESVRDPQDFTQEIEALRYCDVILVDTAGHSQHDKERIQMLKKYTENDYKIDTMLTLAATTKFEDLRDIYNSFSPLNIDSFLFTKLDESRGIGNIFSLAYETKRPISYLSIGQEVPTDLCVASNVYLCDCLLEGFYNPNRPRS